VTAKGNVEFQIVSWTYSPRTAHGKVSKGLPSVHRYFQNLFMHGMLRSGTVLEHSVPQVGLSHHLVGGRRAVVATVAMLWIQRTVFTIQTLFPLRKALVCQQHGEGHRNRWFSFSQYKVVRVCILCESIRGTVTKWGLAWDNRVSDPSHGSAPR